MRVPLVLAAAWAAAVKDWRLFWADRRAAAVCFAVPVALAAVFGTVFQRSADGLTAARLPLAVVDEDDSPLARGLVADLQECSQLDVTVATRDDAVRLLDGRRVGVVLVLPEGLGRLATLRGLLAGGGRPTVELLHHPLSGVESQWAEGLFTQALVRRLVGGPRGPAAADARPFDLKRTSVPDTSGLPFNAYAHSFCGMTLQYLLFWGMEGGLALLRDRRLGLWRRARAAPAGVFALVAGRAAATAAIAFLQVLVTFAAGRLLFGVTVTGSPTAFLALAAAAALLAAAAGLLVAAVGGAEARARSGSVLVILSVSMLGGLWLPAFLLPGWVRSAALLLPTSWAMNGLDGVTWQGQGWAAAGPCVAAVLGFAAVFLVAAGAALARAEAAARRGEGL